jgi:hypothetical protein
MLQEDKDGPWKRPAHWKGPLLFLFVGKSHKMLLGDFLTKFVPFFNQDDLHIVKQAGSSLFSLTYRPNGNTIYFAVHENPALCRERVQAFAAHAVFLDELPAGHGAMGLLEELLARTTDAKGYTFITFTPKSQSPQIKKFVENLSPPLGRKYTLRFLDNPGIDAEAKAIRLQQISTQTADYQKTLLEGAWMVEGSLVYHVPEVAVQPPEDYCLTTWRHVLGIDPGLSSATGICLLAERPGTGKWYVVRGEIWPAMKDAEEVALRIRREFGTYNIVRYVYDSASDWFCAPAMRAGLTPMVRPYDKNNRKEEMISKVQLSLGTLLFVSPQCEDLLEELSTMHWSDRVEGKIANSNDYHISDAFRYAVDCLPKPDKNAAPKMSWAAELRQKHFDRLKRETAKKKGYVSTRTPCMGIMRRSKIW